MTLTEIISEQPQQLAENLHYAGALYLADGIRVTRQYPAESYDPPKPYQDTCPCCGDTFGGVTSGIITPPDETAPLQRVTWDDGGVSAMPPHLLKRA